MSIIAQAVGPTNSPILYTSVAGTSVQTITSTAGGSALVLQMPAAGAAVYNGKPFLLIAQGWVKAHGTSQTFAMGFSGRAFATSAYSGTQLGTGTASGTATGGTNYPWYLEARLCADNTSGILTGYYLVMDGVTPTLKAPTVLASTLTGINFGTFIIGTTTANTFASNPLGAAQTPVLQFALTITNSVSDTTETVNVTSFYVCNDN